jgi:hypothetical protein
MDKPMARLSLLLLVSPLLLIAGCNTEDWDAGPPQTESRTVKLGDAKSARVEIDMPAGELSVGSGAKELLEADFSYGRPSSRPEVEYNVSGGQGRLTIRQQGSVHGRGGGHNKWDLHLSNKVPLELKVDQGAGRARLTLGGLSLSRLNVDLGAGETIVDLTGDWKNNLTANIDGGVGKATVRLPSDVGVRATAHGGIGAIKVLGGMIKVGDAYVNEVYGKSPITVNVNVEGGVGEIDLELGGAPPTV